MKELFAKIPFSNKFSSNSPSQGKIFLENGFRIKHFPGKIFHSGNSYGNENSFKENILRNF